MVIAVDERLATGLDARACALTCAEAGIGWTTASFIVARSNVTRWDFRLDATWGVRDPAGARMWMCVAALESATGTAGEPACGHGLWGVDVGGVLASTPGADALSVVVGNESLDPVGAATLSLGQEIHVTGTVTAYPVGASG